MPPLPLLALLALATPLPSPPAIEVVSQNGRWTGVGDLDALRDVHASMFLISGRLRNRGATPVAHVRLVYELLADGAVVAREWSYNRRAEALRDPAVESGAVAADALAIPPLAPGATDDFRMLFLRGDAPRFDAWRVRIEAAPPLPDPDRPAAPRP